VRRRLGQEAVDKIAEPILGGIFMAEADRLSLRSTFPRFIEMEQKHRSLILAMRRQKRPGGEQGGATSPFRTLPGGMVEMVEAPGRRPTWSSDRRPGGADRVRPAGRDDAGSDGADGGWRRTRLRRDPVRILPEVAAKVSRIVTRTTATVSLGYRNPQAKVALDATGFVIARGENRKILACTWSSKKFQRRAPEGHLLVRIFFGGGKNEAIVEESDATLLQIAREELAELMGLAGSRWSRPLPLARRQSDHEVGQGFRRSRRGWIPP
jgi:oxygen-dependent protoporphyrinogen oxidase